MTYRPIRKSVQAQKLDRETWVSPLRTEYVSRVVGRGEYLTAPMYFGRAYEDPPKFDWYAAIIESYDGTAAFPVCPEMTVGVAEWLQDALGAYVGARVWIKIPCSAESLATCIHPPFRTGENILADGSFEISDGYGPSGHEIPGIADVGGLSYPPFNWSDGSQATLPPSMWYQEDDHLTGQSWQVAGVNPRSGAKHLRQTRVASTPTTGAGLFVTTFLVCPEKSTTYATNGGTSLNWWREGASATVVPGAHWELDFWGMVSRSSAVDSGVHWAVDLMYSDEFDTEHTDDRVFVQIASTSYANCHVERTVPTDLGWEPHLMFLRIVSNRGSSWGDVSGEGLHIDLDDVVLGIE